jgi:hypothetical protein
MAFGYPQGASVLTAGVTVLAFAAVHAFLFGGDGSVHPVTVIATLTGFVLVLAAIVALLSVLHPAMLAGLIVVLGVPVLLYSHRQRTKEQWTQSGRCETCGYDLRASPERCPECNTPVPADSLRRIRAEMAAAKARVSRAAGEAESSPPPPPPLPPPPPPPVP